MRVLRFLVPACWLLLVSPLSGCREELPQVSVPSDYRPAAPAQTKAVPARPVEVEMGIDASGSGKPLRPWCFSAVRGFVADARPGDRIDVRLIGSSAFDPSLRVTTLDLPVPPQASAFDMRARMAAANDHSADSLRAASLAAVREAETSPTTSRTDLTGFLSAAGAVLADADPAAARIIVMCSDGEDTENAPVNVDLRGVRILFLLGAGAGDTSAEVLARTDRWRELLGSRGADVRFVAPGSAVRLDDHRPTTSRE
jgi:hypothetical protein